MGCKKMNQSNNQTALNNFDIFVDVIKDMVGDWINMHNHYPITRNKISIISMTFEKEVWGLAKAKYLDDKFGKYHFEIDMLQGRSIWMGVIDDTNDALVTKKWDGSTYLGFDKKGYSYELTQKEHDYFEQVKNSMSKEHENED